LENIFGSRVSGMAVVRHVMGVRARGFVPAFQAVQRAFETCSTAL
jgi:hypothetical protein